MNDPQPAGGPPDRGARDQTVRLDRRTWQIAGVVVIGAFLSMLDGSIVAVGIDTIARDLGAGLEATQWVSTAYLIALAVSLPICGWLGRRVGVGRLWLISLAGFTVTSLLCGVATNLELLIVFRVLQGLTAGLLVPAGQTILGQAVGSERLGRVMSMLGIAVSFGPAIGPALGGVLIDSLSWEWLFIVNVPLGVAGVLLGMRLIPRGEAAHTQPLDVVGMGLVTLGLPAFIYAVTAWGETGTPASARVLVPLAVGAVALVAFVVRSTRVRFPLTNLGLLRNRTYAAACVCATFTGASHFGALLLLPLSFQLLRQTSVIETGLSLIIYGLGTAIISPFAGRWTDRYGGGLVSSVGCVAVVLTTVPLTMLQATTDPVLLQVLLLLRGMAIALAITPPTIAAYAAVRGADLPDATTQVNVLQRIGGAVGGSLFAVILAVALPSGAEGAFHAAFWWLTGAGLIALASAALLWSTQRSRRGPAGAPADLPADSDQGVHAR